MATRQRLDDLRADGDPPDPEADPDNAPPTCADCAGELVPGAAFCGECGAPVPVEDGTWGEEPEARRCAECDGELVADAPFCGHCGARVEDVALEDAAREDAGGADVEGAPTPPPHLGTAGGRRRRRAPLVVAGVAAALALLVGVALALPGSDGGDDVAAGDTTTTTARARGERHTGASTSGDGTAVEEAPPTSDAPAGGDAPAPDTGGLPVAATSPGGGGTAPVGSAGPSSAPSAPAQGAPSPSPGPPPPPPPPAPPARLVVTSDCNGTCVVPRGGRFAITIANVGGQTGQFTVTSSHPALVPYPSIGTIPGGGSRTVEVVDESGRRRLGLTVEVRGPGGAVIWSATVDLRGT